MRTIAFYVTPLELLNWVEEWRQTFGLYIGVVTFQPRFQLLPLNEEQRLDSSWILKEGEESRRDEIWLNLDPLNNSGINANEVRLSNQNRLEIAIPRLNASTIEEIDMGTVTTERKHLNTWKRIAADLKRKTNSGMWIVGGTGSKRFYKDKRYSAGIDKAVRQGVRLTNLTGLEVTIDAPRP